MAMNRRNVLIGLGTVAVGGGAAFGSGAFSQVDADRTVSFGVSNDSDALVGLSGNSSYTSTVSDNGVNVLEVTVDNLNENATTRIEDIFTITNNDNNSDAETITISDGSNSALTWESSGNQDYGTDGDDLESGVSLTEGNVLGVTLVIDTTSSGGDPTSVSTITVTASGN